MNKRHIIVSASILLTGTGIKAADSITDKTSQPNVILILADDMGYGDVSVLNENSKIHTPNIDAMAQQGITFTDAHSSSSLSTPSRYALLTGRYAFRTTLKKGVIGGYGKPIIAADRPTLGTLFRNNGYSTACIGKWHLGWNWSKDENDKVDFNRPITEGPTERGFDYFFGISASLDMPPYVYVENNTITAAPNRTAKERKGIELFREGPLGADFEPETCLVNLREHAIDFLNDPQRKQQPFFLYLPLTAPHTPILPSAEFQGKSGLSPYGDFVLMVDDIVGHIRTTLKEKGLDENTIVIFTTDNGCAPYADMKGMEKKGHYPSYIYRGAKSDIYDGGHRLPLIISWGKRHQGVINNELVCLADFYATFAQMCHTKIANNVAEDSYSIWPILKGNGHSKRDYIVHHSGEGFFSIRNDRWKLIFWGGSGGWCFPSLPKDAEYIATLPAMQLYDMKNDPSETQNVVEQHPDIVKKLTDEMKRYIVNGRSTKGAKQSNDSMDNWPQIKLLMEK